MAMKIKFYIKSLFIMIMFTAASVAMHDSIFDENNICVAAKFIMHEDSQRQEKFNVDPMNINGEHSYHQHTVAINAKITKGVNTKKKATMDTTQAVVMAIFGAAFTENGENIDITRKFRATRKKIKTLSPDTYRTDITYLHYAALHTIETLANHLVRDALGLASRLIEEKQEIFFGNLSFLTGINRDTFIELFGLARGAYSVGIEARKAPVANPVVANSAGYLKQNLSGVSETSFIDEPEYFEADKHAPMPLYQILQDHCGITDSALDITLEAASALLSSKFLCVITQQEDSTLKCINILKNGKKVGKIKEENYTNTYFLQLASNDTYIFISSILDLEIEGLTKDKGESAVVERKASLYSILVNRYSLFIVPPFIIVGAIFGIKANLFPGVFNGGALAKNFKGIFPSVMRLFK